MGGQTAFFLVYFAILLKGFSSKICSCINTEERESEILEQTTKKPIVKSCPSVLFVQRKNNTEITLD